MSTAPEGFVFIDKPAGITSFNTLSSIKKIFNTGKVGHAGTLDKFASGLLVAMVGRMTKAAGIITALEKEYTARIQFGRETDTLDPEGETVGESDHIPSVQELSEALPSFIGAIEQAPPVFSAVHVNGQRAHRLARQGTIVAMKTRPVFIRDIQVLGHENDSAEIQVICSKGTYIRSLARDLAVKCGSRGYVTALRRTRIGCFSVEEGSEHGSINTACLRTPYDIFSRLDTIPTVIVEDKYIGGILQGQRILPSFFGEQHPGRDLTALFDSKKRFIALIEKNGTKYDYKFAGASR